MKKLFFAAALAVLAFVSCGKEDPNGGQNDAGKAFIQFNITQGAVTRASETPTGPEQVMGPWTLYVFNSAKSLIKIVDNTAAATDAIELTAAKHYFLFAINKPTNFPTDIALNDNIDVVEKKLTNSTFADMSPITTPGGSGGTDFFITNIKREEIVLTTGTTSSTPQTATVQVGRAMAKTRLNPTNSATQTGNGQLLAASVKYMGANNPDAMHVFPYRNATGQLETPYFNDATVTTSKYFPVLATTMTGWETPSSTAGIYVMENSNATPKAGNSSFLLIEGVYEPATWVLKDGQDAGAYTANTTFYRVGRKVAPGTNDKIDTFLPYILKEKITTDVEMEAFLEFVNPDNHASPGGQYTSEVAKYGVEEYVNGVTYYALYLGDQSAATATGRYTVARNYLYNVTINEIAGPGYGDPKNVIPDKEKPLEEQAFLKVTIQPAPWEVVNQGGIIGN